MRVSRLQMQSQRVLDGGGNPSEPFASTVATRIELTARVRLGSGAPWLCKLSTALLRQFRRALRSVL